MTNVSAYLTESAGRCPGARAVVCDHTTTSYSELCSEVARFAEYLTDSGVKPGDRVGVMLPNGLEFTVVFYGVMHAGGVVVPLSPALHARAAEFALTITGAKLLFVTPRHKIANAVAAVTADTQPVEVGNHGIAHLTSGFPGRAPPVSRTARDAAIVSPVAETARAHTVRITHGELVSRQAVTAGLLPLRQSDVVMECLPMTERVGMTCGILAAMFSVSTLVSPGFDPALDPATILETIADERVTVFEGSPAMYMALLDAAHHGYVDFSSLRVCVSAGGSIPEDIVRGFEDRFGCVVVDADECFASGLPPNPAFDRPG
jgi:long-chain acyl-CoA synthetase